MLKNSLEATGAAARTLLRNRGALAIFNALFAALLIALYLFVSTKEARVWQIVLSAVLAVVAPVLFFMIQAAGVRYALGEVAPGHLVRHALRDFMKMFLVSLPLIALAVLAVYLLNKLQVRFPVEAVEETTRSVASTYPPATPPPLPLRWQNVVFPALRLLTLGIILPLAAIHLWIAIAHRGFKETLKKSPRVLAGAFSSQSIVIYAIGFFVFGLLPYLLIFTRTTVTNGWLELLLFGMRLALAFIFTLWGWLITLGALSRIATDTGASIPASSNEATPPVSSTIQPQEAH